MRNYIYMSMYNMKTILPFDLREIMRWREVNNSSSRSTAMRFSRSRLLSSGSTSRCEVRVASALASRSSTQHATPCQPSLCAANMSAVKLAASLELGLSPSERKRSTSSALPSLAAWHKGSSGCLENGMPQKFHSTRHETATPYAAILCDWSLSLAFLCCFPWRFGTFRSQHWPMLVAIQSNPGSTQCSADPAPTALRILGTNSFVYFNYNPEAIKDY